MDCSSVVERLTVNQDVAGSIPANPAKIIAGMEKESLVSLINWKSEGATPSPATTVP